MGCPVFGRVYFYARYVHLSGHKTGGNFRLLHRLITQVERILEINGLRTVTREVVETARDSLIIGAA
jgi:hypothetical protein